MIVIDFLVFLVKVFALIFVILLIALLVQKLIANKK